jgi:hypothetical protein
LSVNPDCGDDEHRHAHGRRKREAEDCLRHPPHRCAAVGRIELMARGISFSRSKHARNEVDIATRQPDVSEDIVVKFVERAARGAGDDRRRAA